MSEPPKDTRPIAVDLFAGAGGMTLGFEQAGFDVLAAVEIDPIHCLTHDYNFPQWQTICQSVTEVTGQDIRQQSTIGDRTIDVVFGGPPCQGFSLMGKRILDDPRNSLIDHFLRVIIQLQPRYFVMENVPGMAIGQHRELLEKIIRKFAKYGYRIERPYQVLNAVNYGVPQNRERLFLLGRQKNQPRLRYPHPITHPQGTPKLPKTPTVLEAIQDLPEVTLFSELESRDWMIASYGEASDYVKLLRGYQRAIDDYSYPRLYNRDLLTASRRTHHTETSIERFQATKPGQIEPISRFYKLDPDGVCNTLRAGTPGDRGAYTAPRPIHYYIPRCITVREAARLHSYPDWFRFHVTKWHGFRQVGNSVPPLLAKAIAREILQVLDRSPLQPTQTIELGSASDLGLKLHQAKSRYLSQLATSARSQI
jgi:DNA (cytosine-5)-methyltransferase 1